MAIRPAIRRIRSPGVVSLAIAGAAVLGISSTVPTSVLLAGPQTVIADAALLTQSVVDVTAAPEPTEAWVMGKSDTPIPSSTTLQDVWERYINPQPPYTGTPGQPIFTGQPVYPNVTQDNTNPLFTPENLYPTSGIKNLELDQSVNQGVQILDATVLQQASSAYPIVVLGYSQSATMASLAMPGLADGNAGPVDPSTGLPTPSTQVPADALNFVLLGDPNNPDGGLLSRFDVPNAPLTIPSIGITFSGGTPADAAAGDPFDTVIYTQEYDGYGDFPKYPMNFLADLNAFAGFAELHGNYPTLTPAQLASAVPVLPAVGYDGDTSYFMIPTENLPLLDPIRDIPVIGNPLADLLQPDLTVLVNLGYGPDPDIGWSTTGANLSTPFEPFFPTLDAQQFGTVLSDLGSGLITGIQNAISDLSDPSNWVLDAASSATSAAQAAAAAADPITFTDIVNALSSAASSAYAVLLPTADIINFLLTTLPAYDVSLFTQELSTSGGLLDAIGMPIAADTGLVTMAVGFEFEVISNAIKAIIGAFSGL